MSFPPSPESKASTNAEIVPIGDAADRNPGRLGTILTSIGDAVLVTDVAGRITLLNPVAETLTGWTMAEAVGQDAKVVFDIVNETTRLTVESPVERVLRKGLVVGLANHTILRRRDGSEVPIDDSAAPVRDARGELTGVVLVFRDISERRQAETALRIADERLRLATESAHIGTWDLDPVTDHLFWDERCRAAFDYPLDLPIDFPTCLSLIHDEDRERTNTAVQNALSPSGNGEYAVEFRAIGYGDGVERWVRVEGKALFDDTHSAAVRFVGTIQDITERKQFEEELREARTRLESALLAGEIATWTFDIVQNRVVADANMARLFSVAETDALGGTLDVYLAAIHPEDRDRVLETIQQAMESGKQYEAEYRVVLPDGASRWLVARGRVERDANGVATALPGVVLDITARKEAAEELARSEARFRMQADAMPQMVWATDPEGNHLYYNRRWYEYTGQTIEESLGFGFALALHPDDQERTLERWRRAWQNGDDYEIEYRFRRFDGVYRWFVGRAAPIRDIETGEIRLWAGTCTDIDELKQAQERQRFLSELTERTRRLLEPRAIILETVHSVGAFLGLSRLLFAEMNESAETIRVFPDWFGHSDGDDVSLPSAEGIWRINEWGRKIAPWGNTFEELRHGHTVVVRDTATDPRTASDVAADRETRARAVVRIPLLRNDNWVALLSAQSATPRDWSAEEIALLEAVAERLWLTLENVRLFRETKMRADREALVNDVGTAIRSSPLDSDAILRATVNALGQGLQADRCYYVQYDQTNDTAAVGTEWHRAELPPLEGRTFQMSVYSVDRDPRYRAGQTHVVNDVIAYDANDAAPLLEIGLRSILRVPLQVGNRMTALAVAMSNEPRVWTRGETRVVETVASQLQSALDAARLLNEERQRARREHLLNEIGEAVRSSSDPDKMQAILVERLGTALQADRCFLTVVDQPRGTFEIQRDYCSDPELPSLAGRHLISDFTEDLEAIYRRRQTLVVADTAPDRESGVDVKSQALEPATAAAIRRMGLRSLVNVPLYDGSRLVGALGVGTAKAPRQWAYEDVALIESVASQARAAIESARLQQRERNIATQLQDALQPPKPPPVPGLHLDSFYRPALAEASVGGDFFDVFPVGGGNTALVVADLSGKGLAAAQQVATVKNMLRYAVYSGTDLAEIMTQLHQTLVQQDLLTGFATLFIGCYDPGERTLTYVNCGQEPGLVWRAANGEIEQLLPTGPILGGFFEGSFEKHTLHLDKGDVLALFTDGLTEIGPNRAQLLEVEGVIELLRTCCNTVEDSPRDPEELVEYLMAGVDAYAGGGVRDDIALLVGVVGNTEETKSDE
jgi:PAS domain S-box-containing protein